MKKLLALLLLFGIVGCEQQSSASSSKASPMASVKFEGVCKDEEIPSPYKEVDEYRVQGSFSIYKTGSFGFILPTEEEILERNSMLMPDVADYEDVSKDMYASFNNFSSSEKAKHFAKSDIPRVKIYKISKEIYQNDIWNVDGYHSYVDGEGDLVEETRHYGYVKASCTLNTISREGIVTDEFADQFNWCFDLDCFGDIKFRGGID